MKQVKVIIENKIYYCQLAEDEADKKKGLMDVESLPPDEGILFIWDEEDTRQMWMKNTLIPLDIIFIDEDEKVIQVSKGEPQSEKMISSPNTLYVLEVNQGSGIKEGDNVEIEDDSPVMKVLAPDGSTAMELWGGERIFRRAFGKQLIRLCKKADMLKKTNCSTRELESLYMRIGRKMFKEIKAQDERPAEYVQAP